jgi:hypothetical protein
MPPLRRRSSEGSIWSSYFLRTHHRHRRQVHDVVPFGTALQDMDRLRKAGQQGSDPLRASNSVEEFVGDVAGFPVGEDEDIGAAFERTVAGLRYRLAFRHRS